MSESGQRTRRMPGRLALMQLQGVVTTGIYCRATCRARPKAGNVRPVPSALSALASGFRPCLLCRPDLLPDLGPRRATPAVAHALRLIAQGFLDDANEAALAARVGYSARQLRRLFEAELGASPDFVARAHRAHLARRLLDETARPITDIAFAAGFSSVRQMNRVMRELFGFAPSQLRAKRARGDLLDPLDGGLALRLPYTGSLDFDRMLAFLGARAIGGVEEVESATYRRTINCCGHPGVVEVRAGMSADPRATRHGPHLEVRLHLPTFGSILEQLQRVRALFGLARNDEEAEDALATTPLFAPHADSLRGLRMIGAYDPFETSIRVLVGQQISVAGATTICTRLAERYGEAIDAPLPGSLGRLFPSAARLAEVDPSELEMPGARAAAIVGFARAVASGELDLEAVLPLDVLLARLQALPGIGPWSAHLIAARVFDQSDAFPAGDLGLRRAAGRLAGRSEAPDARELEEMSRAWRPWRARAAAWLWMSETNSPSGLQPSRANPV